MSKDDGEPQGAWVILTRRENTTQRIYDYAGSCEGPYTRSEALRWAMHKKIWQNGQKERRTLIAIPKEWWVGFDVVIEHMADVSAEVSL